jgi:hypothetical protein
MENFIVRVYRRSRTKPSEVAGLVETVGTDEKRAFQSFAGLITVLKNAILRGDTSPVNSVERDAYSDPDKKQAG